MKKFFISLVMILCISLLSCAFANAQAVTRTIESFNDGWKFVRYFHGSDEASVTGREPDGLQMPSINDNNWRNVDLPHDWAIEGPFSDTLENSTGLLPWKGIGWYRKHFTISDSDKGKKIYIDFEGAMANAKVWLNGKFVGEWPYGYTSFRLDLTPYALPGKENIIAVRLDTKNWDSRWYPGAGIYRNVWLVKTTPVHVVYNGLYCFSPEIKKDKAALAVQADVENNFNEPVAVTVKASVYKLDDNFQVSGDPVAQTGGVKAVIPAAGMHHFILGMYVKNPVLWNIEDPELYRIVVNVSNGDKPADMAETNFGFRTIEFTARDGFHLNGKKVSVNGVCDHHDLGALGTAFYTRAAQRQLEILREMGCNAIRTSHNPPAPELLDLCDKMGFLVMDEAFDAWITPKKPLDYNKLFPAWQEEDLKALVRRDRNHPSVILWSIGNEINDQDKPALSKGLNMIVKSEDMTRPVTAACNWPMSGTDGFQKSLDVFGINYNLKSYESFFSLSDNANMAFFSSESASTVSSRGEYYFPVKQGDLNNNLPGKGIFQLSSYDLAYPGWATTPDQQWEIMDRFPGTFGEFVWTGFDYLGEPTPYDKDNPVVRKINDRIPSRSSYFGIMDLAGFRKDRFWLYQSRWRPELPMAHILPHWNWPERKGEVTPVMVYTSGDAAELFLNGKSLGMKKKGQYEYRLRWDDVVYQPGELKVVAYKNGQKWAEDVVKTTGKPSQLIMSADRPAITTDGNDLVYITVTVADKDKLPVPRSDNQIDFSIEGPGRIVATDNGDAASLEPFQAKSKKAYNGLCLVIVAADKGASGTIKVNGASKGLKPASVTMNISK
ncbi:MAG: beta-galactosidase GalB [Bacteroidales bacterium]|jgi:beta-galactosidase